MSSFYWIRDQVATINWRYYTHIVCFRYLLLKSSRMYEGKLTCSTDKSHRIELWHHTKSKKKTAAFKPREVHVQWCKYRSKLNCLSVTEQNEFMNNMINPSNCFVAKISWMKVQLARWVWIDMLLLRYHFRASTPIHKWLIFRNEFLGMWRSHKFEVQFWKLKLIFIENRIGSCNVFAMTWARQAARNLTTVM